MKSLRAAPTLWSTLAFNLASLWLAVALVTLADSDPAMWLPAASLALSGTVGLIAFTRPQTRRFGAGCLGGTAASCVVFFVLLVIFFVTYFVLGGRELS